MNASVGWPPSTDEPDLVTITTAIEIEKPVEVVFGFATHAAQWHRWHPATASVSNVADRPLIVGDQVTESIRAGARSFDATWTVVACEAPNLWVISTRTEQGLARIAYRLAERGAGCQFGRTLEYRSLRWPWRALDSSITRLVLARQSATALANLKRVVEAGSVDVDASGQKAALRARH
jgi:hypothetical protein